MDPGQDGGRHLLWSTHLKHAVGFLLAMVGAAACSEAGDGNLLSPTVSEVVHELHELPEVKNICATDPDDPMCTEEDENGCIPIEDPNWCQGSGGPGDPGGDPEDGGGTSDPPPLEGSVSLECDKNVVRGSSGGCTLSGTGDVVISNIEWEAQVFDQPATGSGLAPLGRHRCDAPDRGHGDL